MSRFAALDWYDTPLYYDIVFSGDDRTEGEFLSRLVERFGPPRRGRRRSLEPACGSGRMLLELARRDFDVCGFDLSAEMLAFARARLRKAGVSGKLFEARLEDFAAPGKFDLAHCMVNTFKYLLDEESVQRHFERVAKALKPGGLYVVGLHLTQYADRRCNHERWRQARGPVEVTCNIRGWPPARRERLERVRSRLAVVEKGVVRRTQTEWKFRTYDWKELQSSLRRAKSFEHIATYDFTYDLDKPREMPDEHLDVVVVLRKLGRARGAARSDT
jgi:SAM-dependent methyltransferase